ncbi:DUF86 domain-containing protein [Microbacteriaceae bacterium 4G12]
MYFVDRKKIEHILECLEQVIENFQEKEAYTNTLEKYALERMAHLTIDCVLDVGNAMIDGFIMRDPGSYEDIIEILIDEKVVDAAEGEKLKEVVRLRKMLVQDYMYVQHEQVFKTMKANLETIKVYPSRIRRYLEQELGPVSAFTNS